jgi:putative transposase
MRFEEILRKCFFASCVKLNMLLVELDIMPDHIHLFVKCVNTMTPVSKIVAHMKGFSSYTVRKTFPKLRRYKAFWSPSYFIESIGNMSEGTIRKYIRNQKVNLKSSYKYKDFVRSMPNHMSNTSTNKEGSFTSASELLINKTKTQNAPTRVFCEKKRAGISSAKKSLNYVDSPSCFVRGGRLDGGRCDSSSRVGCR